MTQSGHDARPLSWQTAIEITPRHNYLDSTRGKGIECPQTLARLKGCPHLAPPAKAAFSFVKQTCPLWARRSLRTVASALCQKRTFVSVSSSPLRVGCFGAFSLGTVLCRRSKWWHCLLALWLSIFGGTPQRLPLGPTRSLAGGVG